MRAADHDQQLLDVHRPMSWLEAVVVAGDAAFVAAASVAAVATATAFGAVAAAAAAAVVGDVAAAAAFLLSLHRCAMMQSSRLQRTRHVLTQTKTRCLFNVHDPSF